MPQSMVLIPGCTLAALLGELLTKSCCLGLTPRVSDSTDLWGKEALRIHYFLKGCLVNLGAAVVENLQKMDKQLLFLVRVVLSLATRCGNQTQTESRPQGDL